MRGAVVLDVDQLEADLSAGRLESGVGRWCGDFLHGLEGVGGEACRGWLEGERERMRRLVGGALQRLVADAEARGEWSQAVLWAERWTDMERHSQPAHTCLIEALRLAGRPEAAAAVFAAFDSRLRSELGEAPSAELVRLGTAGEPVRRLPERLASQSAALFSPDLVGRGVAFAQLVEAWGEVERGGGAVVLVGGEEGMGKTRLCEEFLHWLGETGAEVLALRAPAYQAEREVAWAAVRDLLSGLSEAPGLGGAPDTALAALATIVPGIRARFPRLPEVQPDEDALGTALVRVLTDVAAECPVVLLLDDFPAADPLSRRMLLCLARRLPGSLLLVATGRADGHGFDPTLHPFREIARVRWMSLPPLSIGDAEAMLDSMLLLDPPQRRELALRLQAEGEGNPFYMVALVSALADAGHLAPDSHGIWRTTVGEGGTLPLPASVVEAVRARLDHLGDDARQLIGAAAVMGRVIDSSLLQTVAAQAADRFCAALEELVSRRLLRAATPPAAAYEFTHDLVRRVTYELLSPARHQLLQRKLSYARDAESSLESRRRVAAEPPRRPIRLFGRDRTATSRWAAVLVAMVVPALVATALWPLRAGIEATPVLAIGAVEARPGMESPDVARALQGLLASGLAQVPQLRVVSIERMYEVHAQLADAEAASPMAVARAAGADELITGRLDRRPDGGYRLELRRVDLRTGMLRGTITVEGAGAGELVSRAVARLLSPFGIAAPPPAAVAYRVRPASAQRQYQEGLAAYYRGDLDAAERFFMTALTQDSSFALAAYYARRTRSALGQRVSGDTVLTRTLRWIDTAPEPERLLTRALWAAALQDPAHFTLAESLAVRYPLEPEAHLLLGRAKRSRGDFLGAIPHLRRVIMIDSLGLDGRSIHCRACDAYGAAIDAHALADSSAAALRWAREWTERQPTSARAWNTLAELLLGRSRFSEALAAKRTAVSLQPGSETGPIFLAHLALRSGDWTGAERILGRAAAEAMDDVRTSALWWLTISLREQGRLREALETARHYRAGVSAAHASAGLEPRVIPYTAVHEAQVLFELGRYRAASVLFDSIAAAAVVPESRGATARAQAWVLTHSGTALAYAQDTAALAPLAERVRVIGAESGYGRDWRLHHYLRGLLLVRRGRNADAEREFRRAIYSVPNGFSRVNLELARTLRALGRADEAVAMLEAALRGPLEASGLYLSRTELHLELAGALEQAGRPERAIEHYRWVLRAWERADPIVHERREGARERLAALAS